MATKVKRKRLWVDSALQSRVLLRIGIYGLLFTLVLWHVAFFFDLMTRIASNSVPSWDLLELYADFASRQRPLMISVILIAPIVLYDLVKFSHRVAGPLDRCRTTINDMVEGKTVPEFKPRENDLMPEFFDSFNALTRMWNAQMQLAAIEKQREELAPKANANCENGAVDPQNVACAEE